MTWQAVCVSHEQAGSRYGNPMEIQCNATLCISNCPRLLVHRVAGQVHALYKETPEQRSEAQVVVPCKPPLFAALPDNAARAISPTLLHGSALPAGPGLYGGCKLGRHQSSGSGHQGADLHPCISNSCNKYVCITECYRIMFCHILPC